MLSNQKVEIFLKFFAFNQLKVEKLNLNALITTKYFIFDSLTYDLRAQLSISFKIFSQTQF